MAAVVQVLDGRLRGEHGCVVLLIHHSGHLAKDRARGSSTLRGALDSEYQMVKDTDGTIRLINRKMKDALEPPPMAFELRTVHFGFSDAGDSGSALSSAVLEPVEYTARTQPNSGGLGKNQQLGLDVLRRIVGDDGERILVEVWKAECHQAGMIRQRFYDVRVGLADRGKITVDGAYVSLAA